MLRRRSNRKEDGSGATCLVRQSWRRVRPTMYSSATAPDNLPVNVARAARGRSAVPRNNQTYLNQTHSAHLPVGDDVTPSSMGTPRQRFDTGSIAHTSGTAPTPLPWSIPHTESSPQGDISTLAACGFIGPNEERGTSGPSPRRVQPLWVVDDMLLLRQRSSKTPNFPVPPETNNAPSTTAAV